MENNSHDNSVNVKLNNRITVYGNVFMLSGASVILVGFLFLAIFLHSYWQQAVTLATIVVYGLVTALFVTIAILLRGLWEKVVAHPSITREERKEALRDQQRKSRLIWAQENCLIYEERGEFIPVFPEHPLLIEAPQTPTQEERKINEALVLELYDQKDATYENVAKALSTSYHQIQKVCSAAVRSGHTWKNR